MTEWSGPLLERLRRWRSPIYLVALGTAGCLTLGMFYFGAHWLLRVSVSEIVGEVAAGDLVFPASAEIITRSSMLDAAIQNTPGYSEGYAAGVPSRYDWCSGSYKPPEYSGPPSDFTAVTGWGQVYANTEEEPYSNPAAQIEIANAKTYVRIKSNRQWLLVQEQIANPIRGAYFVPDFSSPNTVPLQPEQKPDGTAVIGPPPADRNAHFWMVRRGSYPAESVDGVYVQMDLRVSDPKMNLVANVGADWWRNSTADFVKDYANNPTAGTSNWIKLSTEWSTLRFYSPSTSELVAAPPPLLAPPPPGPGATVTRRRTVTPAPCASRLHHPLPKALVRFTQR